MKARDHIDQDEVIYQISYLIGTSVDSLTSQEVTDFLSQPSNRSRVSARLEFPRVKFNRWYKTTFLNQLNEKISQSDKIVIKQRVSARLELGLQISREFKEELRSHLSREYYKPIYDMQISNTIQVWKRAHSYAGEIDVSVLKQLAAQ